MTQSLACTLSTTIAACPLREVKYGTVSGIYSGANAARIVSAALTGNGLTPEQAARPAQVAAINQYGKTAAYRIEYPEDLQVFGLSFNTALGASGWALQGEYSFHPEPLAKLLAFGPWDRTVAN